ncbi:facilitated trehalose transporter Tret1-like isoform X2 [Choristoneura fumiferana]|uniref:facilitated trehalose transporter Tret1-like isoform X2 n=1 Tax=Choristoneura fumiferana TaxID=7141 RepID=UPI003D15B0DE
MRVASFMRQFLGAAIMSFPKFLLGSGFVWPSYAIIILRSSSTPLSAPITLMGEALTGSLPLISSIVTSPFGGVIVDKIGRRYSGILTCVSVAISWIFIGAGKTVPMLLVGRFIFGVSGGLLMQVAWSFTAEISEDAVRGFMSSMPSVMYALGALVSIILGWVTSYHNVTYINIGLALTNAFTMWVLPESPVYLALIGKHEEALKSLSFYRASTSKDKAVIDEMSEIRSNQANKQTDVKLLPTEEPSLRDQEKQNLAETEFVPAAKVTSMQYFRISPAARWSFFVVAALMTQSILTGVIAVQVYGGPLFLKATPSLSPDLCAVFLGSILLVGSICGAAFTDLFGRRILLMTAAAINGICMLALGTLVRWAWGPEWLVPTFILVFSFVFNLGGGMIPYVLLAEVFVPEVKGFAQSITMLWLYIVHFILLLAFVPAVELIGLDVVFFVFAACAFSTTLLTHYLLPETKGLNPYVIEDTFAQRIKEGRRWASPVKS